MLRLDQKIVEQWIKPNSRVLDLGCGDGSLLAELQKRHNISGYGLEIDPEKITLGISKGLSIIEQDLNNGLGQFANHSFDMVVMTQALQSVAQPDKLLLDMLRVGREAVITFPNFAHYKTRFYLTLKGEMPVSKALPYTWYNTPNIHLCTFKDFEDLCKQNKIRIINRIAIDQQQQDSVFMKLMPNLFGEVAIYRVTQSTESY